MKQLVFVVFLWFLLKITAALWCLSGKDEQQSHEADGEEGNRTRRCWNMTNGDAGGQRRRTARVFKELHQAVFNMLQLSFNTVGTQNSWRWRWWAEQQVCDTEDKIMREETDPEVERAVIVTADGALSRCSRCFTSWYPNRSSSRSSDDVESWSKFNSCGYHDEWNVSAVVEHLTVVRFLCGFSLLVEFQSVQDKLSESELIICQQFWWFNGLFCWWMEILLVYNIGKVTLVWVQHNCSQNSQLVSNEAEFTVMDRLMKLQTMNLLL